MCVKFKRRPCRSSLLGSSHHISALRIKMLMLGIHFMELGVSDSNGFTGCRNYRWEILVAFWLKHLLRSDLRLKNFPRGACPHTPLLSAHLHTRSSTITRPHQSKIAGSVPVYSLHKSRNFCSGFLELNLFLVALPLLLISCCHHHYVPEGSLHMCACVCVCACVC